MNEHPVGDVPRLHQLFEQLLLQAAILATQQQAELTRLVDARGPPHDVAQLQIHDAREVG
jgi:hypothetical protein